MQKNQTKSPQVALITGAAKRIGAEIARVLHQAGMNVVLHYNTSRTEAETLCHELNAERVQSAVILQADLLDIASLPKVITTAVAAWGELHVLVNNASCFNRTPIGRVDELAWDALLTCNLKAPYFLAQAALPYLAKNQGAVVNIADVHGERSLQDYSVYSISKAGLIMLTKALAKELGASVRVNAVSPGGGVAWPEGDNALTSEEKQKIVNKTALKKAGAPIEVAKAVLFLVRDADYVTGQILAVDGGRLLMI